MVVVILFGSSVVANMLRILALLIRFSGTIVGVEDISPYWEDSKWRPLKVNLIISCLLSYPLVCFRECCNINGFVYSPGSMG